MDLLEVRARWDDQGRVWPEHFTWEGQAWRVVSTGRRWQDDAGQHVLCMVPGGNVFELIYRPIDGAWSLGFHNVGPAVA